MRAMTPPPFVLSIGRVFYLVSVREKVAKREMAQGFETWVDFIGSINPTELCVATNQTCEPRVVRSSWYPPAVGIPVWGIIMGGNEALIVLM